MLLKHWNLILIFLTFSIISCESSKNEPEVNSTPSFPVGREFNVSLNIAPFLEVAEQPLSRSTSRWLTEYMQLMFFGKEKA